MSRFPPDRAYPFLDPNSPSLQPKSSRFARQPSVPIRMNTAISANNWRMQAASVLTRKTALSISPLMHHRAGYRSQEESGPPKISISLRSVRSHPTPSPSSNAPPRNNTATHSCRETWSIPAIATRNLPVSPHRSCREMAVAPPSAHDDEFYSKAALYNMGLSEPT